MTAKAKTETIPDLNVNYLVDKVEEDFLVQPVTGGNIFGRLLPLPDVARVDSLQIPMSDTSVRGPGNQGSSASLKCCGDLDNGKPVCSRGDENEQTTATRSDSCQYLQHPADSSNGLKHLDRNASEDVLEDGNVLKEWQRKIPDLDLENSAEEKPMCFLKGKLEISGSQAKCLFSQLEHEMSLGRQLAEQLAGREAALEMSQKTCAGLRASLSDATLALDAAQQKIKSLQDCCGAQAASATMAASSLEQCLKRERVVLAAVSAPTKNLFGSLEAIRVQLANSKPSCQRSLSSTSDTCCPREADGLPPGSSDTPSPANAEKESIPSQTLPAGGPSDGVQPVETGQPIPKPTTKEAQLQKSETCGDEEMEPVLDSVVPLGQAGNHAFNPMEMNRKEEVLSKATEADLNCGLSKQGVPLIGAKRQRSGEYDESLAEPSRRTVFQEGLAPPRKALRTCTSLNTGFDISTLRAGHGSQDSLVVQTSLGCSESANWLPGCGDIVAKAGKCRVPNPWCPDPLGKKGREAVEVAPCEEYSRQSSQSQVSSDVSVVTSHQEKDRKAAAKRVMATSQTAAPAVVITESAPCHTPKLERTDSVPMPLECSAVAPQHWPVQSIVKASPEGGSNPVSLVPCLAGQGQPGNASIAEAVAAIAPSVGMQLLEAESRSGDRPTLPVAELASPHMGPGNDVDPKTVGEPYTPLSRTGSLRGKRKCPICKTLIAAAAADCCHCGHMFRPSKWNKHRASLSFSSTQGQQRKTSAWDDVSAPTQSQLQAGPEDRRLQHQLLRQQGGESLPLALPAEGSNQPLLRQGPKQGQDMAAGDRALKTPPQQQNSGKAEVRSQSIQQQLHFLLEQQQVLQLLSQDKRDPQPPSKPSTLDPPLNPYTSRMPDAPRQLGHSSAQCPAPFNPPQQVATWGFPGHYPMVAAHGGHLPAPFIELLKLTLPDPMGSWRNNPLPVAPFLLDQRSNPNCQCDGGSTAPSSGPSGLSDFLSHVASKPTTEKAATHGQRRFDASEYGDVCDLTLSTQREEKQIEQDRSIELSLAPPCQSSQSRGGQCSEHAIG